jgi:hypothetical protein
VNGCKLFNPTTVGTIWDLDCDEFVGWTSGVDNLNLVLCTIGDQLECGLRQWVKAPTNPSLELNYLFQFILFDHGYPPLLEA